jgi:hypothetical protein
MVHGALMLRDDWLVYFDNAKLTVRKVAGSRVRLPQDTI